MAYINQEKKAEIAPIIKAICKKFGVKASLAVGNHSTLVLNVKSGSIDFIGNFNKTISNQPGGFRNGTPAEGSLQVNPYWFQEHFDGKAKQFLKEVLEAMNNGNWDKSDIQSDYFNVGWYVDVNIGRWNKPYIIAK
jgi:hypothetical protein